MFEEDTDLIKASAAAFSDVHLFPQLHLQTLFKNSKIQHAKTPNDSLLLL
jgi:hypothetical protein